MTYLWVDVPTHNKKERKNLWFQSNKYAILCTQLNKYEKALNSNCCLGRYNHHSKQINRVKSLIAEEEAKAA